LSVVTFCSAALADCDAVLLLSAVALSYHSTGLAQ
jgi:hypothetical protein